MRQTERERDRERLRNRLKKQLIDKQTETESPGERKNPTDRGKSGIQPTD